ncbi:MAG: hypothetical protein ACW99Q_10135 [Candidatus Kariarchaeaceae archaeon]
MTLLSRTLNIWVIRIGLIILLIQNILWYISGLMQVVFLEEELTTQILALVFIPDIVGFFVLTAGYFLFAFHETNQKWNYILAAILIGLWVALTVFWRYALFVDPSLLIDEASRLVDEAFVSTGNIIADIVSMFVLTIVIGVLYLLIVIMIRIGIIVTITGLILALASIFIWRAQKHKSTGSNFFLIYGLFNFLSIIMIPLAGFLQDVIPILSVPFGFGAFCKIAIVPLAGIITYVVMLIRSNNL